MDPVLTTPRLALREMVPGDLDFVAAMLADPQVMRFYPKRYSREEAEGWLRGQLARYARDGHGLWLTLNRQTSEPVGQVGLLLQQVDGTDEPEVGYLIHRPYWRRGYAAEAAAATRDHAFHALGQRRVISLIRPDNLPSQGVARKIGMSLEKTTIFRERPSLVYSVRRDGAPQAT
jgi:RimJ/RimL family protein N-acetyltransferase